MAEFEERNLIDKSFFLGNAKGEALPLSVESALGRGLTDFRGWYCTVGVENLHISPDGNIYGGACRNNGFLGNVYERVYRLNHSWHRCTRASCSCGADMQLRKVKDLKDIPLTYKDIPRNMVNDISEPTYAAPVHQDVHRKHPLTLTWDIGRRCNYSCSYCQPAIANTYESHRTWGSLMFAWEGIDYFFLKGRKAKFVFTGGEPTINPSYLEFVKFIHEKGHVIHTTTNGSRLPQFYADLIEMSFIGFSYHLEFAKIDRFTEVMKAIVEKKKASEPARHNWCGIRIMVPPGRLQEALDVRNAVMAVEGLQEQGILIFMSPCYDRIEHTKMMPYMEDELRQINLYS